MKKNLLALILFFTVVSVKSQYYPDISDNFFEKVPYIGAFGTQDWTSGWANFNCQNTVYAATTVNYSGDNASGEMLTNQHWTADKVYFLQGWVYVTSGVTLTIDAGTVIRGEKSSKAALIIEPGGKLIAEGTAAKPIVFTSNEAAGSRVRGDWGGIVLCGKAVVNSGTAQVEGGPRTIYGGTTEDDNSGILKYVRIEFAGYPLQPNKEINGLTFGAVGSGTTIDYVQVSYSNDDSYEWFGGSVNCKHLIAYRGLDDEFDTDFGYHGKCQFLVSLKDSAVADVSQSNGFESDNDATGSDKMPKTSVLFSNVSFFGPKATLSNPINPLFRRNAHIRRNSALSAYNVIFSGFPIGLCIDGSKSYKNATGDTLKIHNSIIAGCNPTTFFSINTVGADVISGIDSITRLNTIRNWFLDPKNGNDTLATNDLLKVTDPFNYLAPNFLPKSNSVLLKNGYWAAKTISVSGNNTIVKGYTSKLTATIKPAYAPQDADWSVDDATIATVDATGKVTGVSAGNAIVTATAKDGSGVKVTYAITILAPGTALQPSITDPFFDKVPYIGAMGTTDWTSGWANFNCQTTTYPATTVNYAGDNASGEMLTNQHWTSDKVYFLQGWVYVTSGVTLTIDAGTVIRGEKSSKAALIIEPGGKLIAEGTSAKPIVFTSNEAAGSRVRGDWGGLVLCGKAILNQGSAQIEGGPRTFYGGNKDDDNSGTLKYVRIEFAGYPLQPNKEINGLTFGGVGSGTTIDYVQVSYSNDDSYEWFGGSVNCKHLIAYRGLDDEFDTDFGYHGKCQFLVSLRDSAIADISQSNGFESDNDATGSVLTPKTSVLFANVSFFGPKATLTNGISPLFRRAAHIRRNSALNAYNVIFSGFPIGLCIDGSKSYNNATGDTLKISNSVISGSNPTTFFSINTVGADATPGIDSITRLNNLRAWFMDPKRGNDTLATNDLLEVTDPFNYLAPNFLPKSTSFLLSKGYWAVSSINISGGNKIETTGGTLQLTAAVAPNYAVQEVTWSVDKPDFASIDATGKVTAKVEDGSTVTVTATAKDGSGVKGTLVVTLGGQIKVKSKSTVKNDVYPNPASTQVTVSSMSTIKSIAIFDITGKVVRLVNANDQNAVVIDINGLNSGMYFIKSVYTTGNTSVSKLMKK